jgi:hypothetical protein
LPFDSFFYFRYLCFTTFRQSSRKVNGKVEIVVPDMQRRSVLNGAALLAALALPKGLLYPSRAVWGVILALILAAASTSAEVVPPTPGEVRLEQLVEANIVAVHAYQKLLARKQGNIDFTCWPAQAPSDAELRALLAHQTSLLAVPVSTVKAWAQGGISSFDSPTDLDPLLAAKFTLSPALPVNVFTRYLQKKAPSQPSSHIRSVANLYQTVLEVERDGDLLQDLYAFYIGLGLPVYVGQFGLPGSDEDFLTAGRELERPSCSSPVGLSAGEWQIAGRKIWNWGEKNLHIRDAKVLANELLTEPDVAPLIPRMKAMPAERVAIIGHSYTMDLHWSSPSAFVPIVTAMFARNNPKVEFQQFQAGGLTSTRAYKRFYQDSLAWKPALVLLVVANRTDEDRSDLHKMAEGFKAAGARVLMFDNIFNNDDSDAVSLQANLAAARAAGIEIVEVSSILESSPDRERFSCLDHIHMTEPYHRLMAKQWLKALLDASTAPR